MQYFDELIKLLEKRSSVVLVHDVGADKYTQRLRKAGPPPLDGSPRPVGVWKIGVGFVNSDGVDAPPDTEDLVEVLEWIGRYEGAAIFVLHCDDLAELVDLKTARHELTKLKSELAEQSVSVVLFSSVPFPEALAGIGHHLGEASAGRTASGRSANGDGAPDWSKFKQLELAEFDTQEWEDRLARLTPDDVRELVRQRAHQAAIVRVNDLREELKKRFESRDKIVDALCCSAVAQVPTVLIGPPGTAKSALVRAFCEGLGLTSRQQGSSPRVTMDRKYFEYMLTRFTTPEEIFGPWHLKDLIENQLYRRVTAGHLPEARIVFLDEIFKASGAILNTLLTLLNERIFYNGGSAIRAPLIMAFAASNELPLDENLRALVDRFPLRVLCPRVESEKRKDLVLRAWEQGFDRQFSTEGVAIGQLACPNDLRLLHQVIRVVYGGRKPFSSENTGFEGEFYSLFNRFEDLVSDRTAPLLLSFARAHALLLSGEERSGRAAREVMPREALEVYRYISCDEQHQRNCENYFRQADSRL